MIESPGHVGLLYVNIFIGHSQSLKDKRMVVKSLKDRIHSRFNVSVSEINGQDKWQVATLGIAMIGPDQKYIEGALQSVLTLYRWCP